MAAVQDFVKQNFSEFSWEDFLLDLFKEKGLQLPPKTSLTRESSPSASLKYRPSAPIITDSDEEEGDDSQEASDETSDDDEPSGTENETSVEPEESEIDEVVQLKSLIAVPRNRRTGMHELLTASGALLSSWRH
jgi:hypothetical protein